MPSSPKDWFNGLADDLFGPAPGAGQPTPSTEEGVPPALAAAPPPTAPQEMQAAGQVGEAIEPQGPAASQIPQAQPQSAMPAPAGPSQPQLLQQTTQYTPGVKLDPMAQSLQRIAGMEQQDAVQKMAEAQAEQSRYTANVLHTQNLQIENNIKQEQARQAEIDTRAKEAQGQYELALKDYSDNKKVNPNRYMESLGTGGRVLATIAQAFGAFGAAITHSPNFAAESIQRAIDADIRAQEHDIASRKEGVGLAQNRVAYFRQRGLDAQSAASAARVSLLQEAQQKIAEFSAQIGEKQQLAVGQQMAAQLQAREAQEMQNNFVAQQGKATTQSVRGYPAAGGGKQLPANESEKLGTANSAIEAAKKTYDDWNKSASGVYGFITSFFPNTDASRYANGRAMAKQIIGSYLEGGVLRKEDEAKYDRYLPERGESEATALDKRNKLIALIATRAEAQRKAHAQAGYNVSDIKIDKPVSSFRPIAQ